MGKTKFMSNIGTNEEVETSLKGIENIFITIIEEIFLNLNEKILIKVQGIGNSNGQKKLHII